MHSCHGPANDVRGDFAQAERIVDSVDGLFSATAFRSGLSAPSRIPQLAKRKRQ